MKIELPRDYLDYIEKDGVDAASTEGQPGYFQLWHPDDIEKMNRDYKVADYAAGFLGFGSDGGGEMLAFDSTGSVYMIPFVGMEPEEAQKIAESWSEIASRITE
jgi:hypothetical protein